MPGSDLDAPISTEELPSPVKQCEPSKRVRRNRAQRRQAKREEDDDHANLVDGSSSTSQNDKVVIIERSDMTLLTATSSVTVTEESVHVGVEGKQKPSKRHPNYFVALPISGEVMRSKLEDVQKHLVKCQPSLKRTLVDIRTLHLTLMVFYLDEDLCLHDARRALQASVEAIKSECDFSSLTVQFEGLDSFRDQVLFAKPKENEEQERNLAKVAEIVIRCFKEHGIASSDNRPFNAHMTIAKLSNAPELRRVVKKFKSDDYYQYAADDFGIEDIKVVQLCSMLKPKQENGYYHVAEQLSLFGD
uniref:A-kinase anchor protein 7-like phosphoesterase domain-containing protein n=1 Tax=Plectus sambesii TaxID=2011161 RepID=A0A914X909_9BILA